MALDRSGLCGKADDYIFWWGRGMLRAVFILLFIIFGLPKSAAQTEAQLKTIAPNMERCMMGTIASCDVLLPFLVPGDRAFEMVTAMKECYQVSNKRSEPCDVAISYLLAPASQRHIETRQPLLNRRDALATAPISLPAPPPAPNISRSQIQLSVTPNIPIRPAMGANTLLELSAYVGIPILAFCVLVFLISSVAHRSVTSEDFGAPLSTQIPVGTKDITVLLRIRRTHRFTWLLGRPKFILYFKADVSQEDLALIKKYKLHKAHLYTSEEFKAKQEEAFAPIDFTTLWRAVKGLFGKLFSFLDLLFLLKIKIGTLVRGKRVEKGELGDLLAFVNAGGSLQHFAGAIMQH